YRRGEDVSEAQAGGVDAAARPGLADVALDRAGLAQAQLHLGLRVHPAALGTGPVAADRAAAGEHEAVPLRAVGDVHPAAASGGTVAGFAAHHGAVAQLHGPEAVDASAHLGLVGVDHAGREDELARVQDPPAAIADVARHPRAQERESAAVRDAAAGGRAGLADVAAHGGVGHLHDPLVQDARDALERLVAGHRHAPSPHEAGVGQAAHRLRAVGVD